MRHLFEPDQLSQVALESRGLRLLLQYKLQYYSQVIGVAVWAEAKDQKLTQQAIGGFMAFRYACRAAIPKRAPMTICLRWCAGDDDVGGVVPVPIGPSAGNEAQEFGAVVPEGVFG